MLSRYCGMMLKYKDNKKYGNLVIVEGVIPIIRTGVDVLNEQHIRSKGKLDLFLYMH